MATLASCAVIFGSAYAANSNDSNSVDANSIDANSLDNWVESTNWLVTSYGNANETLYSGEKTEVFDRDDKLLGLYREDFLYWVEVNGSGIGDGIGNDKTKFLVYDYDINDGKTYYLVDYPRGAYNNPLHSWMTDNPSVAVNPPLPYGTRIRFKDLNLKVKLNHPWVEDLLLFKTFHADDRFCLFDEEKSNKKIDVYVGVIERKEYDSSNYQALLMEDVTMLIEQPSPDLNKDGFFDYLDFLTFAGNWLKEDKTQFNPGDLNYDGKVDLHDFARFANKWRNEKRE